MAGDRAVPSLDAGHQHRKAQHFYIYRYIYYTKVTKGCYARALPPFGSSIFLSVQSQTKEIQRQRGRLGDPVDAQGCSALVRTLRKALKPGYLTRGKTPTTFWWKVLGDGLSLTWRYLEWETSVED